MPLISFTARPCDINGNFVDHDAPPPPRDNDHDFWPFEDRFKFEFTEWNFEKAETSEGELNDLLANLSAKKAMEAGDPNAKSYYDSASHMKETIDSSPYGDLPWSKIHLKHTGLVTPDTPEWKLKTYTIYTRDPLRVAEHITGNTDFVHSWDYVPFEEYTDNHTVRRFSNLMSGTWANKKAVSSCSTVYNPCSVSRADVPLCSRPP